MIENFFNSAEIYAEPRPIEMDSQEAEGYELAYLDTNDFYRIGFFYLKLDSSIDNRKVGLRQMIAKYINIDADAGIGVFDDGNHWRLSFITDLRGEKTSPKRYTFVFGKSENGYRTAVDRFMELQRKGISFANIKDAFSVEALTKQFYNDLFGWYTWALDEKSGVYFPENKSMTEDEKKNAPATRLIRLITRLMFVWFIKQKGLVPDELFKAEEVTHWLKDFDPQSKEQGNYYQAILQNLFFATLNRPIKTPIYDKDGNKVGEERRAFAHVQGKHDVKSLYRYQELFKISEDKILSIFEFIPFINGGLFECLDKDKTQDGVDAYWEDGFTRNNTKDSTGRYVNRACIPNKLFFDPEDGIISIFNRYNFTVEENSPSEQQVALDPELLGKVFENLLGVYNPETHDTARSQSGSFYTPREIVNYMVDRSLEAYLGNTDEVKLLFRDDFVYDDSKREFYDGVIKKLKAIKVLDPACGSGAFPMGMLNRIVEIMQNLNAPGNKYDLKLEIMENCIYGGDIQTIAAQITKLRFFISLVCDCKKTDSADDNYGIPDLPNLETHFVTCDSLIGLKKTQQYSLFEQDVIALKEKLRDVRHEHFTARTVYQKTKLRNRDKELRDELAEMLKSDNVIASEDAKQMAAWNPYDQNGTSPFFDPEWMFGIKDGFDVVIGNPPYIQLQADHGRLSNLYRTCNYKSFAGRGDIYCLFYEKGVNLLNTNGILCYITSNKWMRSAYGKNLKKFFLEDAYVQKIIDFEGIQIFESATVETNIALIRKTKSMFPTEGAVLNKQLKVSLSDTLDSLVTENTICVSFKNTEAWVINSLAEINIEKKLGLINCTLGELGIDVNFGQKTGYNQAFIINEEQKNAILATCITHDERLKTEALIRPTLRGRDIDKYYTKTRGSYIILAYFGSYKILKDEYPAIYRHLIQFEDELKKRGQCTDDNIESTGDFHGQHHWLELDNNPSLSKLNEYSQENLIWKRIGSILRFSYSDEYVVTLDSTCYATGHNLKSICCILNSQMGHYILNKTAPKTGTGDLLVSVQALSPFKIPRISEEKNNLLVQLYEQLKEAQSLESPNLLSDIESKMNKIVFDLYGMQDTEITYINSLDI